MVEIASPHVLPRYKRGSGWWQRPESLAQFERASRELVNGRCYVGHNAYSRPGAIGGLALAALGTNNLMVLGERRTPGESLALSWNALGNGLAPRGSGAREIGVSRAGNLLGTSNGLEDRAAPLR